jgi:hypothetical protein
MTDAALVLKADPLWGKRCIAYNLQADLTDDARRIFVRAQERLQAAGPGLLTGPPATLHISVACLLSVRERYGVSKDSLWRRHRLRWTASLRELLAAVPPCEVIFRRLEVTDAAVIAVAEPQDEVRTIRSHVADMLADVGVPSFQPSIIHATVLRYGSSELRAEALAEAARRVHIESTVPIRQLVLAKETIYPSLVREVIECMTLRGDSSLSTPSTFS